MTLVLDASAALELVMGRPGRAAIAVADRLAAGLAGGDATAGRPWLAAPGFRSGGEILLQVEPGGRTTWTLPIDSLPGLHT